MAEQQNNHYAASTGQDDEAALESALNSIVKALKSLTLYPAEHPHLDESVSAAFRQIKPLLLERELLLLWSRESCTVVDRPALKSSSSTAKFLAREMLTRKLQKLIILTDLTERDLKAFLTLIATDPAIIHEKGGIEAGMRRAGITTIGANEVDLAVLKNPQNDKVEEVDEDSTSMSEEEGADPASANSSDAPLLPWGSRASCGPFGGAGKAAGGGRDGLCLQDRGGGGRVERIGGSVRIGIGQHRTGAAVVAIRIGCRLGCTRHADVASHAGLLVARDGAPEVQAGCR